MFKTLTEVPADTRIAFFGNWISEAEPKVPVPEGQLCLWCTESISSRDAGVSLRAEEDEWVQYHDTCWMEALEESDAVTVAAAGLDAEDLEPL